MKKIASIICFVLLIGCGHSSMEAGPNVPPEEGSKITKGIISHPNLTNIITSDILGGLFRASSTEIEASINENRPTPVQANKNSESLTPPTQTLLVDTSLSFQGGGGKGEMILSALGTGQKIMESETSETAISYHYDSLTLRLLFFNFAYYNPCFGLIRLDGEIRCEIIGDYKLENKQLIAKARCQNGPKENRTTLLYITEEGLFDVAFDADLEINGNPFSFGSYKQKGTITIDGQEHSIDPKAVHDGASCSLK